MEVTTPGLGRSAAQGSAASKTLCRAPKVLWTRSLVCLVQEDVAELVLEARRNTPLFNVCYELREAARKGESPCQHVKADQNRRSKSVMNRRADIKQCQCVKMSQRER